MKIGIYARGVSEKSGGVKQYIESVTRAIIENVSLSNELYIFHNNGMGYFDCSQKGNVKEIIMKPNNKVICDFLLCPYYVNKYQLDAIIFPKNVVPFFLKSKTIVVVHDLAYFMPEYGAYPFLDTVYMKKMLKSSCKRADMIVAVSKNTKNDIIRILGVEPTKIKVVHEAADTKYRIIMDRKKLEEFMKKYNLKNRFILFTGGISPRKNLIRLMKAFQNVSAVITHDLVITGGCGWKNKRELEILESNRRLKRIGFVPEDEMPYLYNLADIFIYPSLYEGFGLPVLEAQACGVPVIASNVSSIPEVGGNSVCYVNPNSTESIADAILKVSLDKKYKKSLVKRGFRNIKRFSWKKAAKKTLDLFEKMTRC